MNVLGGVDLEDSADAKLHRVDGAECIEAVSHKIRFNAIKTFPAIDAQVRLESDELPI